MSEVKYDAYYREDPKTCGDPFAAFVERAEAVGAPGVQVLDLGCGQGRDALVFARRGCRVVGIDVSVVGVDQLNAAARREGLDVEARVGDARDLEDLGDFDVVVLDRVLHMLDSEVERREVLTAARGATRPGGEVLVADEPKHMAMIRAAFVSAGWSLFVDTRNMAFARRPGERRPPSA